MVSKNTIIIESNAYTKRNKYFWENENGILYDLSEDINSFCAKNKRHYKKFAETAITDIADELIQEIISGYSSSDGICIEVNGTENDFLCIKEIVDNEYSSQGIECVFGSKHLEPAEKVILEIKNIYKKLTEIILEYSSEEKKRFFGDLMNESGNFTLFEKCKQADNNLGEILEAVKEKADNLSKAVKYKDIVYEQKVEYEAEAKKRKMTEEAEKLTEIRTSFDPQVQSLCEIGMKRLEREYTSAFEKKIRAYFADPKRKAGWNELVNSYVKNDADGSEERITQYIDGCINYIEKEIEKFWGEGIKKLKDAIWFFLQDCNQMQITERQRQRMCRCLEEYENLNGFRGILQTYYQKKYDIKKLTTKNASTSYNAELTKILKAGKQFIISKKCKESFKAWSSGLSEKMCEAVKISEASEMPAEQKDEEDKDRLILIEEAKRVSIQQKMLQDAKKEIEKMISFREVS